MSENIKYILIAHGGGDGICAASIAVAKLQDPIDLYFTQSYTIKGLIQKLIRTEQHDKVRLYILDVHINTSVVKLLQQFNRVIYIDHHHNSVKNRGIFPGNIDQYKSSSQLASEYFSALKSPLATLGTICEKMLTVSTSDPMLKEALMLQKAMICKYDDDQFRKLLVEQLSTGLMPSQIPEVKERIKSSDATLDRLIKQANSNKLEFENCIITIINENGKGFGRQIANKVSFGHDNPVFLLYPDVKRDKMVIIARHNPDQKTNIDLSQFMSKYFDGGGHASAAGGAIEGIDDCAVQVVNNCFEEYLKDM